MPPTVLKFEVREKKWLCCARKDISSQRNLMNQVIRVLRDSHFEVSVIKSVFKNFYIVTLDLSPAEFCHEAAL